MAVAVSDTHPLIVPRIRNYLIDKAGFDAVRWRDWQTHWLSKGLQGLETRLVKDADAGPFCHGDTPTLADICLFALYEGAGTLKIKVSAIPTLDRLVAHCASLPAFADAHPTRQADYPG